MSTIMQTGGVASQQIGRLTLPRAVAGHPVLELCNTRAGWRDPEPREYLQTYEHLLVWARELGLLRPADARRLHELSRATPEAAEAVLERARLFREDFYKALTQHPPAAVLERLSDHFRDSAVTVSLHYSRSSGLALRHDTTQLELPLHEFVDAGRRLVEAGLASDVGRCPGTGCGWLFLRNGRNRRWCIMSICGNRAKVRRFSQRQRAERSPAGTTSVL